jgi:transcription initiation factor TFIID subunit 11
MEHFLTETSDHNSSFFQPPTHDDDEEEEEPEPEESTAHSPPAETASALIADPTQDEPVPVTTVDRPRTKRNFDEEANIKLQVLVSNFSDEQLDRYEMYRRSAFSKVAIKRLMHSITGSVPSSNVVIAIAGIAKVFVGEIVEEALEVQRQESTPEQKTTPLEPKHLREAYRRIHTQPHCPAMSTWKAKRKSRF